VGDIEASGGIAAEEKENQLLVQGSKIYQFAPVL
jgi:hypothetical protein